MDQPLPSVEPYPDPETLRALRVERSQLPVERYDNGLRPTFVNLPRSSDDVAALRPDFAALAELGIMVSCFAGSGSAWKTRVFAPSDGVPGGSGHRLAAGRSQSTSAGTGSSSGGGSRISQGVEIGRPSTLFARADARDGELVQSPLADTRLSLHGASSRL